MTTGYDVRGRDDITAAAAAAVGAVRPLLDVSAKLDVRRCREDIRRHMERAASGNQRRTVHSRIGRSNCDGECY